MRPLCHLNPVLALFLRSAHQVIRHSYQVISRAGGSRVNKGHQTDAKRNRPLVLLHATQKQLPNLTAYFMC